MTSLILTRDSNSPLVVDASIAIKRYLNDEDFVGEAQAVLTSFAKNEVALLAPDHIRYEVANAIRTALRRGRLDPVNARLAVDNFLAMDVTLVAGNDLLIGAYDFAIRLGCSYYDALYLALSSTSSCPFIHADRRLHNTLAGRFEHELWIEDYSTAS